MLVQDIVNQTSTDFRTILASSGADANIIMNWVDRVQKDCLHSSIYSALNRAVQQFTCTNGTSAYTLATAPRRIVSVFNRTGNRVVTPYQTLQGPVPEAEQTEGAAGSAPMGLQDRADLHDRINSRFVEFYQRAGSTDLLVYPTPVSSDSLEVTYELEVATVSSLGTTLTLPDDALDMVVAGTNLYMAQYLARTPDVQTWGAIYEKLKKGELVV